MSDEPNDELPFTDIPLEDWSEPLGDRAEAAKQKKRAALGYPVEIETIEHFETDGRKIMRIRWRRASKPINGTANGTASGEIR